MQENEDLKKYKATAKYNLELPDNPGIRWKKGRKYDLLYNHGAYELSSENGTTFYTDSAFESLKKMFNIEQEQKKRINCQRQTMRIRYQQKGDGKTDMGK